LQPFLATPWGWGGLKVTIQISGEAIQAEVRGMVKVTKDILLLVVGLRHVVVFKREARFIIKFRRFTITLRKSE
jgi:hypothetical protein